MNIDFLRSLKVFSVVADSKNMTQAAKALGVSQSAVSQQLNQLETDLECVLFDRNTRPVALTAAGLYLQGKAPQLLFQADELRSLFSKDGWATIPKLRIAVIGSLAGTLVPPLMTQISSSMNVENLSVSCGLVTTRENALLSRDAELLITSDSIYDVQGLERYPIFCESLILALPIDESRWASSMSLEELRDAGSYIQYTPGTQMGWAIQMHLNRMRLNLPNKLEFDNPLDIIGLVAANQGWTITTPSHVLQGLHFGHAVRVVPFPGPVLRRTVSLIARSDELGSVPSDVHAICANVLEIEFLPQIQKIIPWVGDNFAILDEKSLPISQS